MVSIVELILAAAGLVVLTAGGYLAMLAILARAPREVPEAGSAETLPIFDVIVPAHDEEAGIGATIDSLEGLDYPAQRRRIIVVADNCTDATAEVARRHGAHVWERRDETKRGKGHALDWAFKRSLDEGVADALVVIDADTVATPNLLRAFAARLVAGAEALQAEYGVRNRDASWRTTLMIVALALFHRVRSLGRARLGLSAGLRGNGMCFTARLVSHTPHEATSVVEDLEYGLILGGKGIRVHFVPEAQVFGEMAAGDEAARVQRARWESGRRLLARQWALPLLWGGVRDRCRIQLDLAWDLVLPPLSTLGAWTGFGLLSSAGLLLLTGRGTIATILFSLALACLLVYVVRGVSASGLGFRALGALAWAPIYLVWRLVRVLGRRRAAARTWMRTPRESAATNGSAR
jgi:1,2-diacylglycerol 3-beta-glucosyltransferase